MYLLENLTEQIYISYSTETQNSHIIFPFDPVAYYFLSNLLFLIILSH